MKVLTSFSEAALNALTLLTWITPRTPIRAAIIVNGHIGRFWKFSMLYYLVLFFLFSRCISGQGIIESETQRLGELPAERLTDFGTDLFLVSSNRLLDFRSKLCLSKIFLVKMKIMVD